MNAQCTSTELYPTDPAASWDEEAIADVTRVVKRMGRYYFRHQARGFEHVPDGPTLVVGNHSGGKIPIDTFLFGSAWHDHFGAKHPLFSLGHDMLFKAPPVANALNRLGVVRASRANAHALLSSGRSMMVLPGGDYETYRPYSERNVIDFGGRTGWVKTVLEHGVPITPLVCIGGHELFFIWRRGGRIAKALGLEKLLRFPCFPITFGLPMGVYFGPVPAPIPFPAQITTELLAPVHLDREEHDHRAYHRDAAADPQAVREIYDLVTARMQRALTRLATGRVPILGQLH